MKNIYRICKFIFVLLVILVSSETLSATTTCTVKNDCGTADEWVYCNNGFCYHKSECNNELDDDNDGFIDNEDAACIGANSSDQGKILIIDNDTNRYTYVCAQYTMTQDDDVVIDLHDDSAAIIVKRVEDNVYVLLAKSNLTLDSFDNGCPADVKNPINEAEANSLTNRDNGSGGKNDAVFYNRDGTLRNYYPDLCYYGGAVIGCTGFPDAAGLYATIQERVYRLKAGDVIYLVAYSHKTQEKRWMNNVYLYRNYYEANCQGPECIPYCRY